LRKKVTMNPETVTQVPPPTDGPITPPPEDPLNHEKPVSAEAEPKTSPGNDRPPGGSKSNAFKHGCSGTGKVLHLRDREDVEQRLFFLRATMPPKTTRDHHLMEIIAVSEVLEAKCQAIYLNLLDDAQAAAELQWDLNQK